MAAPWTDYAPKTCARQGQGQIDVAHRVMIRPHMPGAEMAESSPTRPKGAVLAFRGNRPSIDRIVRMSGIILPEGIMKTRPREILLLAFSGFLLFSCTRNGGQKDAVVLIRDFESNYTYFVDNEALPMIKALKDEGLSFDCATAEGKSIRIDKRKRMETLRFDAVDLRNYRAVIVPCMGAAGAPVQDLPAQKGTVALVRDAYGMGLYIAAQHAREIFSQIPIEGLEISEGGIVVSGRIITSYYCPVMSSMLHMPTETAALVKALSEKLGNDN